MYGIACKKSQIRWHIAEKYVLINYTQPWQQKKKKRFWLKNSVVSTQAKVSKTYNTIKMSEIWIATWVVFALKHLNEFVFFVSFLACIGLETPRQIPSSLWIYVNESSKRELGWLVGLSVACPLQLGMMFLDKFLCLCIQTTQNQKTVEPR